MQISAYSEETEPFRLTRLNLLRGLIEYHDVQNVVSLRDDEGVLIVVWRIRPKRWEVITVNDCWYIFNEMETEHFWLCRIER